MLQEWKQTQARAAEAPTRSCVPCVLSTREVVALSMCMVVMLSPVTGMVVRMQGGVGGCGGQAC